MDVKALRRELHANPELSGHEAKTSSIIAAFLASHGLQPHNRMGHGLLYRVGSGSPHRLFRAELDGLPHGHRCGHDGHMAMLAAALVDLQPRGTLWVLFQPAEETGEGMAECLPDLPELDEAYAIHNVPGVPIGSIVLGPGAWASTGLHLTLRGQTAHAAEPNAPGDVWSEAVACADAARRLGTLVGFRYGNDDYGIRPGQATVAATLRGPGEAVKAAVKELQAMAHDHREVEPFPETKNAKRGLEWAAKAPHGLTIERRSEPYPWSEDFGLLLRTVPGALIGFGVGDTHPLHHRDYEFPDAALASGVQFWRALAS